MNSSGMPNGLEWNGPPIRTIFGMNSAPPARSPAILRESGPALAYRGGMGGSGPAGVFFGGPDAHLLPQPGAAAFRGRNYTERGKPGEGGRHHPAAGIESSP